MNNVQCIMVGGHWAGLLIVIIICDVAALNSTPLTRTVASL